MLFARALIAFLVLPGMVAFVVPLWVIAPDTEWRTFDPLGLLALGPGLVLLIWCVREFYVMGRGTLAPWAPPKTLVVTGLYRLSRNPMYLGVSLVLWGWAWGFHSRSLAIYAAIVMVCFHLRVVLGEEPWLAKTHGDEWVKYRARVRRWL